MSYPDVMPIAPFADLADLGPRARRLRVLSYPRYYRAGDRWGLTVEAFTRADSPWVARATEGVHTLAVRRDGLCVCSHQGHELAFRLRGLVALDAAGARSDLSDLSDLSDQAAWRLDDSALDLGLIAWEHATGARYEVRYAADAVRDRLVLSDGLRQLIRGGLPAGAARFGLAFDCAFPPGLRRRVADHEETSHDTEAPIELAGPGIRQLLAPSLLVGQVGQVGPVGLPALDGHAWVERYRYRDGSLLQTVPVEALDEIPELRTTIVYQQGTDGYSGCTDAEIADYVPANNWGGYSWIDVGKSATDLRRSLIRFDLSSLSGVAAVNSATLELYLTPASYYWAGTPPMNISSARVLRDWGEGTKSGSAAADGEVTWNSARHNVQAWTTAGCGSQENDRAAFEHSGSHSNTEGFQSFTWINLCQSWLVDATANYGGILKSDDEGTEDVIAFISRNHGTTGYRPKLTIDYTAAAADLDGAGLARGLARAMPRMMD